MTNTSISLAQWRRAQHNVGEESLTDYLLWQVSLHLPCVKYVKFTRHQEARFTGADWEWWFVGARSSLGLRVQAKLLHYDARANSEALSYKNRHGYQMEKLITESVKRKLLPFYAFYWDGAGIYRWKCDLRRGIGEGAFVTSAFALYDTPLNLKEVLRSGKTKPVEIQDVLHLCNPISCFFCCPLNKCISVEGIHRFIWYYWEEYILSPLREVVPERELRRFALHESVPGYVRTILEEEVVPTWFDAEYRARVGTDAILVVDLRERPMTG